MNTLEARKRAAEQRRERIWAAGGRIVQIALRSEGAQVLATLEERSGKGPSATIEGLLIKAATKRS